MSEQLSNQIPPQQTRAKVLIVEDELVVAENIARNLSKQGYATVNIVDSGEEAIKQAQIMQPDVVLMDIMLQGEIDGIMAANILRKEMQLPIIYMTAYVDDQTLERAKQTEPYGYLVKPFKPYDLKTAIEIALHKYRQDRERQTHYTVQLEQAEIRISQLSECDPLTQLPRRKLLPAAFERMVDQLKLATLAKPASQRWIPVFSISLDRFSRIDQYLGYQVSDQTLQAIADRITHYLGTAGTVVRVNTSEFAMIAEPIDSKQQAESIAQELLDLIAEPFSIHDQKIFLTASIGIAFYPNDDEQLNALLQHSRCMMHDASQQGGNTYRVFNPVDSSQINQLALETDLYYALERQELVLHYQPKVDLQTGQITGAEALLRWQHPVHGMIPPAVFIPIAEETGLIDSIGVWVIRTACEQIRQWQQIGLPLIKVAVNLSLCQFKQPQFHQKIHQILSETQVNPEWLEVELTESTLIQDVDLVVHRLQLFKTLGLQIAIDDFGTGYSSLSHLNRFPFDTLKLDRSFVKDIHTNPKNRAIATAIISMSHQLNLKVVAEGVETLSELAFFSEHQCDEIQGYLFSQSLPAAEFANLMTRNKCLGAWLEQTEQINLSN